MTSAQVNLTVQLGRGLNTDADVAGLRGVLRDALKSELQRIGLPGAATVRVRGVDAPRAFRIRVQGQLQPYPPGLLAAVWQDVAPPDEHHWVIANTGSGDGFRDAWLVEALASLDPAPRMERLQSVGVALTLAVVRGGLPALLSDRVIAAYADAMGAPVTRQISAQEWARILPALIELTGTLADRRLVGAALNARSVGATTQDLVEYIYAALPRCHAEVLAHPDYLKDLHGQELDGPVSMRDDSSSNAWREQYDELEPALFQALGLPMPDVLLVPTPEIEPGHLQVRMGGTLGARVRGLVEGELIARPLEDQAPNLSLGSVPTITIDPSRRIPALLVSDDERPQLEAAGIPFTDPRGLVVELVVTELRRQRRRLLAIEDLDHQLRALRVAFPAIIHAAMATFALPDLVRIARLLLDEEIPIGNLRMILTRLLEYDTTAPSINGAGAPAPSLEACADFVRGGLGDMFAASFASGDGVSVIRVHRGLERKLEALTEAKHEPSDQSSEKVRDATWGLVKSVDPAAGQVVVVTTRDARRALRRILVSEFPDLPVLANSELPLQLERRTVGTIRI